MKVLVTGSAGFIGGYLVEELLGKGYEVVGVDNHSKYGPITKSYDSHPNYKLIVGDARDVDLMTSAMMDCEHVIAGAALIGGITYFHAYAYDLLATNERIMASTCDAAIRAHRQGKLKKVTYLSSSMVLNQQIIGQAPKVTNARSPHHCRRTDFRNLRSNTLLKPLGISTNCHTQLCVRSTASVWAKCEHLERWKFCRATLNWR